MRCLHATAYISFSLGQLRTDTGVKKKRFLLTQSMKGAFDYVIRVKLILHFVHLNRATNQESRTTFNKYVIHRPEEKVSM